MKKNIFKIVSFLIIVILCLGFLQSVFMPKWYDRGWNHSKIVRGFYDEPKNTIDVLFIGSSQFMSSVSPIDIYTMSGITSYNLSTSEQELAISYYWLKEACKYQKPKVVVLETQMLFQTTHEFRYHQGIDYMRFSPNKMELINVLSKEGCLTNKLYYALPLLNYHSRWTDLSRSDYEMSPWLEDNHYYSKGFAIQTGSEAHEYYGVTQDNDEKEPIEPFKDKYLKLTIDYCKENGIGIVLLKTPRTDYSIQRHNAIAAIAAEKEVDFIDYNMSEVFAAKGFDSQHDFLNFDHLNYFGATKMTADIVDYLNSNYVLEDHRADSRYAKWEEDTITYVERLKSCLLASETDFSTYLKLLDNENYVVFISVKDEASFGLTDEDGESMKNLGLTSMQDKYQSSYLAVIDSGIVQEEIISDEAVETNGIFMSGNHNYFVRSAGGLGGSESSIMVDDIECSNNGRGFNIVVFDKLQDRIVDVVNFDTYDFGKYAYRKVLEEEQ